MQRFEYRWVREEFWYTLIRCPLVHLRHGRGVFIRLKIASDFGCEARNGHSPAGYLSDRAIDIFVMLSITSQGRRKASSRRAFPEHDAGVDRCQTHLCK